jgi:hypothetical protein
VSDGRTRCLGWKEGGRSSTRRNGTPRTTTTNERDRSAFRRCIKRRESAMKKVDRSERERRTTASSSPSPISCANTPTMLPIVKLWDSNSLLLAARASSAFLSFPLFPPRAEKSPPDFFLGVVDEREAEGVLGGRRRRLRGRLME